MLAAIYSHGAAHILGCALLLLHLCRPATSSSSTLQGTTATVTTISSTTPPPGASSSSGPSRSSSSSDDELLLEPDGSEWGSLEQLRARIGAMPRAPAPPLRDAAGCDGLLRCDFSPQPVCGVWLFQEEGGWQEDAFLFPNSCAMEWFMCMTEREYVKVNPSIEECPKPIHTLPPPTMPPPTLPSPTWPPPTLPPPTLPPPTLPPPTLPPPTLPPPTLPPLTLPPPTLPPPTLPPPILPPPTLPQPPAPINPTTTKPCVACTTKRPFPPHLFPVHAVPTSSEVVAPHQFLLDWFFHRSKLNNITSLLSSIPTATSNSPPEGATTAVSEPANVTSSE